MPQTVKATFDAERQELRLDEPLQGVADGEQIWVVVADDASPIDFPNDGRVVAILRKV